MEQSSDMLKVNILLEGVQNMQNVDVNICSSQINLIVPEQYQLILDLPACAAGQWDADAATAKFRKKKCQLRLVIPAKTNTASTAPSASTPGATALPPSIVTKEILREGTGQMPRAGDKLAMHYTGSLASNGTIFDSSRNGSTPFVFTIGIGQVIKGWDEGVMTMKLGEKAKLTIPPDKAYGARGAGGVIPPNATLVFEVELLKIGNVSA
jgi:FKBP-type peptidyl-prolyl cis-trans isomerase